MTSLQSAPTFTATSSDGQAILGWLGRPQGAASTLSSVAAAREAPRYAPQWAIHVLDDIARVTSSGSTQPNDVARSNARHVTRCLQRAHAVPGRVIASGEGGVAFIFESKGRYADIECLNDGSVLAGWTNFADVSEVLEIDLGKKEPIADVWRRIQQFLGPG